jgi:GWxTD domain-containing protein
LCFTLIIWNCAGHSKRKSQNNNKQNIQLQAYSHINKNDEFGIQININFPNSLIVFQKIKNEFIAQFQVSVAILDSAQQQVNHYSWENEKTEAYFEDTRSKNKTISAGYFLKTTPGKYSVSILVEDLDSKYRWHKEIPLKEYKSEFISSLLISQNEHENNFIGNIIPDNMDSVIIKVSHRFNEISQNSFINIEVTNDDEIVKIDSIKVKQKKNTFHYAISISEFWLGELIINFNYKKVKGEISLKLPGNHSQYWKDIETTIKIMNYIFTSTENRELKSMSKNEKIIFVKNYWKSIDPTPETEVNEVMNEFFHRVDFSSSHFSEFGSGWQSDRGRVYIIFGTPEHIELTNQNNQGYKYEIWHYPFGKQFIFIDEGIFGNFRLFKEIN